MPIGIVTLTTDFGEGSPYVAEMKGALLSINCDLKIVDATHSISPQNVLEGALVFRQFYNAFPKGTVHVGVVDPGVGTDRRLLLLRSDEHYFIGPDNGLFSFLLPNADVFELDNAKYWRKPVSATFHGRDIMGPVAAHLCAGVEIDCLASPFPSKPETLSVPASKCSQRSIEGEVMLVDSFGNLITNIADRDLLENFDPGEAMIPSVLIEIAGRVLPFASTYTKSEEGDVVALVGSSGWLEVAVSCGNASECLGVGLGEVVRVRAGD